MDDFGLTGVWSEGKYTESSVGVFISHCSVIFEEM